MLWFCAAYHAGFVKHTQKHDATKMYNKLKEVPQNFSQNCNAETAGVF
jgi:hypothetical protein